MFAVAWPRPHLSRVPLPAAEGGQLYWALTSSNLALSSSNLALVADLLWRADQQHRDGVVSGEGLLLHAAQGHGLHDGDGVRGGRVVGLVLALVLTKYFSLILKYFCYPPLHPAPRPRTPRRRPRPARRRGWWAPPRPRYRWRPWCPGRSLWEPCRYCWY